MAGADKPNVVTTRWWWVRHAPVRNDGGNIYGQSDLACDTGDTYVFNAVAAIVCTLLLATSPAMAPAKPMRRVIRCIRNAPPRTGQRASAAWGTMACRDVGAMTGA